MLEIQLKPTQHFNGSMTVKIHISSRDGGVSPPSLTGSLWFTLQRFIFNILAESAQRVYEGQLSLSLLHSGF